VGPMETLAGHEAVKLVATLEIFGWLEGKRADGPGCHGVVVFLVCLDLLSIFNAAVFVVIHGLPGKDGPGTKCFGKAKLVRKSIQPENIEEDHFDDHSWRKVVIRGHVVCIARAFLGSADAPLNVGAMFVFTTNV
jgi:hypothetical protein